MKRREIRPTQSGELRHVANIEQLIKGKDATGSPTVAYSLYAENVRFAIDDWKPTESFEANAVDSKLYTRIRIRYRPGLEGVAPNTMRIAHVTNPGQSPVVTDYYDIQGAVRDITLRVELQLLCIRRDAVGFRTGATP